MSETDDWIRVDFDDELLPEQTTDDTDAGWGERPSTDAEDISRLLDDRPPHYDA